MTALAAVLVTAALFLIASLLGGAGNGDPWDEQLRHWWRRRQVWIVWRKTV